MKISNQKIIFYLVILLIILPGILSGSGREDKEMVTVHVESDALPPPGAEQGMFTKPSRERLMKDLTPLQYRVTQEEGTEAPFQNEYWDNHEEGIYVDIVSGEPLFSSMDKYESGTGWPSFTRPLSEGNVISLTDKTYGMVRTEVRSLYADSHLGHVFNDGPEPTGLRYCINSASLRFISVQDLEKEGYAVFLSLFNDPS